MQVCTFGKCVAMKLEQVAEEKDVEILIDDKLKVHHKKTAAATKKKANGVLGLLKKSFRLLRQNGTTSPV